MQEIITKLLKKISQKTNLLLGLTLLLTATVSVYSLLKPVTTTNENTDNSVHIGTTYDYKAKVMPNILYPNGGTIEAGDAIFRKITTAIPVNLKTTVNFGDEITVKGTHEVQLVINANGLWEKSFPLDQQQSFEQKGTEISIIDKSYQIDLEKINAFIIQVEEETGIKSAQYTIEVVPNIFGTINNAGTEWDFQVQDKLIFQYAHDEIKLASEKAFTSAISFSKPEVITNTFNLLGLALPLALVRTVSVLGSFMLVITLVYLNKSRLIIRKAPVPSQIERINKKYGSRIIQVSERENIAQKSIITVTSFKSILRIADEKELSIFFQKVHYDGRAVYFIVEGDFLYTYETVKIDLARNTRKAVRSDELYAEN